MNFSQHNLNPHTTTNSQQPEPLSHKMKLLASFSCVYLFIFSLSTHAFLLPTPSSSTTTPSLKQQPKKNTALPAHSHLQAALHLIQGNNNNINNAATTMPPSSTSSSLSVHLASNPDPEDLKTGTGDPVRILTHRQSSPSSSTGNTITNYLDIQLPTKEGISLHDITPQLRQAITEANIKEGWVTVVSRHTTTAVTLNECESRLMDDVRQFLIKLAPPTDPYLHNDIHLRPATEEDRKRVGDWDLDEWRAQEPKNCHSHLLSMLLGNTLNLPVTGGKLAIGRWQSVMMVELDGPRERTVGIQVVGFQ